MWIEEKQKRGNWAVRRALGGRECRMWKVEGRREIAVDVKK
jgi:hypothetical protein